MRRIRFNDFLLCAGTLADAPSPLHFNICFPEHSTQTLRCLGLYTPAPTRRCALAINLSPLPWRGRVDPGRDAGLCARPTITLVAPGKCLLVFPLFFFFTMDNCDVEKGGARSGGTGARLLVVDDNDS